MVYGRRRYRRRNKRFRRFRGKAKRKVFAKRVRRVVYAMAEHKLAGTTIPANTTFTTTPVHYWCTDLGQGSNSYTRVGKRLEVSKIRWCFTVATGVTGVNATDDSFNQIRIVLAQWDSEATANPFGSILMDSNIDQFNYGSLLRRKFYDRKKVMYSRAQGSEVGYDPGIHTFRGTIKFKKPIRINFKTEDNTQPTSRIVLSVMSDSSVPTHPYVIQNGWIHTHYTDI